MSKKQVYGAVDANIAKDYELLDRIGRGAYGIVWKARRRTGAQQIVAIKKVYDAFRNTVDAQRTYREVVYLKAFMEHDNIITLLDVIRPVNDRDLYLIFDHMDTDLKRAVDAKILTKEHEAYVMYQILRVRATYRGENNPREAERSTQRERVYRHVVDVWSIGCILGYMLRGGRQGATDYSQSTMTAADARCLGKPDAAAIKAIDAPYAGILIAKMSDARRTSLKALCPTASAAALDFLSLMLVFNPEKRPRILSLLPHGYMRAFRQPMTEKTLKQSLVVPHVNDPNMTVADYQEKLYEAAASREFNLFLNPPHQRGVDTGNGSDNGDHHHPQQQQGPSRVRATGVARADVSSSAPSAASTARTERSHRAAPAIRKEVTRTHVRAHVGQKHNASDSGNDSDWGIGGYGRARQPPRPHRQQQQQQQQQQHRHQYQAARAGANETAEEMDSLSIGGRSVRGGNSSSSSSSTSTVRTRRRERRRRHTQINPSPRSMARRQAGDGALNHAAIIVHSLATNQR
ncbi:CMGC/MAPK/ERK7 protein kinase [Salpingoeca rosetta]|uniref:CMGC/MAPK/ERK7 protein kinase n=1 Tax=Salpingoeca rosetta (strain ATCC 50818 / BSB-021) TaxID=946362 RepID=F2U3B5_SALR5|nr:CMGC/MAPK/ERK7 protein kinase [Salpingoeca rosetta]EGD82109.1 CMGC/MAPK/ERK7 protein kinase [Salpingoeca rosetta]|eukprot:XP_004996292.1 CMGC/MAPK/ERK7 protein kinase [Salpingoeca rosetta]